MLLKLSIVCLLFSNAPPARSVVVTTDCGVEVDDQWAITHLALCSQFDFKGIVTTHAPTLEAPPPRPRRG